MTTNSQLSAKDILDKNFKTSMRGYNQEEVDEFLDIVIQDFENFNSQIEQLRKENEQLKSRPEQTRMRTTPTPSNHQVNYDILKRVSNLEKAVFGKKYTDD